MLYPEKMLARVLPLPEQATLNELEACVQHGIMTTLNRHGLFTTPEIDYHYAGIVQALSAQASHQRLRCHCLAERSGLIREDESWRFLRLIEIPEPQEACPQNQWRHSLALYLEICIVRHDALFPGQSSPLE